MAVVIYSIYQYFLDIYLENSSTVSGIPSAGKVQVPLGRYSQYGISDIRSLRACMHARYRLVPGTYIYTW